MKNDIKESFQFVGRLSGDYESFCFDVEKQDFIEITNNTNERIIENRKSPFNDDLYQLYPTDLLKAFSEDKLYDFKITIEAFPIEE